MTHHLVGAAEVADMLGVSRQHVSTLANAKSHAFPEPEVEIAAGRIWRRDAIDAWIKDNPARVGGRRPVCNFCGRGERSVEKLVQGPKLLDESGVQTGWTAICSECIELAAIVVLEEAEVPKSVFPGLRKSLGEAGRSGRKRS